MKQAISLFLILFLLISKAYSQAHAEPVTLAIGNAAPDFNLKGVDGKYYSLEDFDKADVLVIVFSCNHCPTAQAYEQRIMDVERDYRLKKVQVVMISPNSPGAVSLSELGYTDMGDTYEEMQIRAKERGFNFPYLYDGDEQKAALAYGPVATPHCFVFDRSRILRFAGRVDSSEKPGTGHGEDLRAAIEAVLAGKNVNPSTTKVFGCSIKWSWKDESVKRIYKQWAELPVTLDDIDDTGIKDLVKNSSNKLRLINFWATWCGPCVTEFPDLVVIDRMYRGRPFEFITVSADRPEKKTDVLSFLREQQASNKNFIYKSGNVYEMIEAVDPDWQGGLPYTMIIEPGGKIIYKGQNAIEPLEIKKLIVEDKYIGRYY